MYNISAGYFNCITNRDHAVYSLCSFYFILRLPISFVSQSFVQYIPCYIHLRGEWFVSFVNSMIILYDDGLIVCAFLFLTCAFATIIQYIVTVKYWIVTILAQFDHYSCPILFATVNCLYFKTELIYYLICVLFNVFFFIHSLNFFLFCSIVHLQTKMFQKLL